ncbi:MAG: hypothetical protein WBV89_14845 [Ilumatobacter sp.]
MTPLERQQLDLIDPTAHTFWHWVRFDLVAAEAERRHATTIVDIGAGSGMLGDRLVTTHPDLGYRFQELSPALDAALGDRYGDEARFGPDDRLTRNTLGAMLDVIEHIEDDVGALDDWRRRMDPGAALVITVPAMQWAFSSFDVDLGHYRRYSRSTLRATLEDAGYTVRRCDYLFPEMLPVVLKRRLRPSTNTVDMPEMSPAMNRIGHLISSTTARGRRVWPLGTSVIAVAEAAP